MYVYKAYFKFNNFVYKMYLNSSITEEKTVIVFCTYERFHEFKINIV